MKIHAILLIFILTFSLASADTFILGNVYKSNPSDFTADSIVTVTCNGNTLSTTSKSDGSYGVGFEVATCPDKSSVSILATKDSASGTGSATIDNANATAFFTIKNIKLNEAPCTGCACTNSCGNTGGSSGGGGGGGSARYYMCGNGVCDSGETASLCPQDCHAPTTPENIVTLNGNASETTASTEDVSNPPARGFLASITGAATGLAGKPAFWGAMVFVMVIVGGFVFVRRRAAKRKAAN